MAKEISPAHKHQCQHNHGPTQAEATHEEENSQILDNIIKKASSVDFFQSIASTSLTGSLIINIGKVLNFIKKNVSCEHKDTDSCHAETKVGSSLNLDTGVGFYQEEDQAITTEVNPDQNPDEGFCEFAEDLLVEDLLSIMNNMRAEEENKSTPSLHNTQGLEEVLAFITNGTEIKELDIWSESKASFKLPNGRLLELKAGCGKLEYNYQNAEGESLEQALTTNRFQVALKGTQHKEDKCYSLIETPEGKKLIRDMREEFANLLKAEFTKAAQDETLPEELRTDIIKYLENAGDDQDAIINIYNQIGGRFIDDKNAEVQKLFSTVNKHLAQKAQVVAEQGLEHSQQFVIMLALTRLYANKESASMLQNSNLSDQKQIQALAQLITGQAEGEFLLQYEAAQEIAEGWLKLHRENREATTQHYQKLKSKGKPKLEQELEASVTQKAKTSSILLSASKSISSIKNKLFGSKETELHDDDLFSFVMGAAEGKTSTQKLITQVHAFDRGEELDTHSFAINFGETLNHYGKFSNADLAQLRDGNYAYFPNSDPFATSETQSSSIVFSSSTPSQETQISPEEQKEKKNALEYSQRILSIAKQHGISPSECASVGSLVKLMKQNGLPLSTILNAVGYSKNFIRDILDTQGLTAAAQMLYSHGESLDINELFNFHKAGHSLVTAAQKIITDNHTTISKAV